jgi:hypothetical protein
LAGSPYLRWLADGLSPPPAAEPAGACRRDAVLGYAVGYGVPEISPFVRSLRSVFVGRVILVVSREPELLGWLQLHDVEAIIADDHPRDWKPHPVVARFAAYAQILQGDPLRNVVATDVRDVVLQSDPFGEEPGELEFFVEAEHLRLSDHAFNLKHLTALVGVAVARRLDDRVCVCVGVVACSGAALARFCRTMLMLCAIPRSGAGGAFGADQAACNLIAHLDLIGREIRPNYGRVATIGLTPPEQLRLEDDLIRNPDGSVSAIVHQYDRIPALAAHVRDRWGDKAGPGRGERRKSLRQRAATLGSSVTRRLPELR